MSIAKYLLLFFNFFFFQSNEGEAYLTVTWELPEAASLALPGNPLIPLKLSPNARKTNGFFPDVQLLPEKNNLKPNTVVRDHYIFCLVTMKKKILKQPFRMSSSNKYLSRATWYPNRTKSSLVSPAVVFLARLIFSLIR